jgi:phosphatidylserine/phosphatidylglycerophosphate/cardiolipin synthase-like enzyme
MHEKALVTDGDSGDELLIGSMNLSPTSLTRNRELAFALDPTTGGPIIAAVESTFDKDFASTSA